MSILHALISLTSVDNFTRAQASHEFVDVQLILRMCFIVLYGTLVWVFYSAVITILEARR